MDKHKKIKLLKEIVSNCQIYSIAVNFFYKVNNLRMYKTSESPELNIDATIQGIAPIFVQDEDNGNSLYDYLITYKFNRIGDKYLKEAPMEYCYINLMNTVIYNEGSDLIVETFSPLKNQHGLIINNYKNILRNKKLENV